MQPQDSFSVTRRTLDVEDYIDILRRHKTWIFGPTFAGLVIAVLVAFLWPDTYVSTAVIKVVPPQVPESLVQTNVNVEMNQRINAMAQSILSRSNLTNLITTNALYASQRNRIPLEDVIETMKTKDIKISAVQSVSQVGGRSAVSAFQISYEYNNPSLARKVCAELVSKFMSESFRERENSSNSTTLFLKDQWEAAKKELDVYDQKLTNFQMRNSGRLPDQMESNLQQLHAMQERMTALNAAVSRTNQEKMMLESNLKIFKDQYSAAMKEPENQVATPAKSEKVAELERQILILDNSLALLKEHYTDTHPDVQRIKTQLASTKLQREQALKEEPAKKLDAPAPRLTALAVKEARDGEASIKRLQAAIEAKDLEAREYQKELNQLNTTMKNYQGRIEGIPLGLKEYSELTRDRELAKAKYQDLDARVNRSQMSTDLEHQKQGETLEVLDQASLPMTPVAPKRPFIVGVGTALGLLLGLFLAGGREMKDTSLKNLKDVRAYTQLTILGSIPLLENDLVVRRRRRIGWLAWSTACLVGVAIMSSSVIYYYTTKG